MDEDTILSAIGSTEPSTFNEFLRGLGSDSPGEKSEYAALFRQLESLEREGFVEIERSGKLISSLILSERGADRVRGKLDAKRGLLGYAERQS